MNIALIGAGNIAWHLAKALLKAVHSVKEVWNRNQTTAIALAKEVNAEVIKDLESINSTIELIIIAVSDEAIDAVASKLKVQEHQIVVHTSGSTDMLAIAPYFLNYGVLYPLQTFSKTVAVDFKDV